MSSKKGNKKRAANPDDDPVYAEKRARNNEAVRKSRDKSKKKAEETMARVQKLKEENKKLEGKIDEQKKTKKFLKDLFLQQTTAKMQNPTPEQWALINEENSEDEIESEVSTQSSIDESSSSEEEPAPKRKRGKK
ncbi:hypothetical protein PVAND_014856 [Polypedilum vanderplanki]|uniref:BZIP domain-containing protein n=1 Tax=Polypedilum vanderplanki TaxID=319348 RepID=A0A9J6BB78_POLVA|nr:hypothetical protein PVAND_014856 [Polypedilum vanderplanki]